MGLNQQTLVFFPRAPSKGEGERASEYAAVDGAAMDQISTARARWWRYRGLKWLFLLIPAVALAVFYATGPRNSLVVDKATVTFAIARNEPFHDFVPLRGQVEPRRTVLVAALQGGQIERVIASDGMIVVAGEPLAQIRNPQFLVALTSQEAEITSRLGDISARTLSIQRGRRDLEQSNAASEQALSDAEDEYNKQKFLFDKGIIAQSRIDVLAAKQRYHQERLAAIRRSVTTELAIATREQSRIRAAEVQLDENLRTVRGIRDALILRAPVNGRLTNFRLQPGQTIAASDNVGQVDSEGDNKIVADVDEFYLSRLALGQTATAKVDGIQYGLRVEKVERQVTGGRFKVELTFSGKAPTGLRRGQSIDLKLMLGEARDALTLPNGAWARGSGAAVVFVRDGNGRAVRRAVVLGRSNPEQVEILKGLAAGDQVIVSDTAGYAKFETLVLR